MAKKKQLAGKKTKLAKLPLTQVLASQGEEIAPWGLPLETPPPAAPGAPLSQEGAGEGGGEGAAGPLGEVYLHLVQELAALKSQLQPAAATPAGWRQSLPSQAPAPHRLRLVLRQVREGLQDLHRLLSRP
jgi:hypothetical protein